jgi:Uma2 family endonuclease
VDAFIVPPGRAEYHILMGALKTLLTFEEFERLEDEHEGKTELLEGEMFRLPPPFAGHSRTSKRLFRPLDNQVEECKRRKPECPVGEVFQETGYLLGRSPGTWVIPDVSVTWAAQAEHKYFEGAPMIAVEIISESNYPAYVERKLKLYLNAGAAEVWVIYPQSRHAIVYTASGQRREDTAFRTELLPGIEIPFTEFLN